MNFLARMPLSTMPMVTELLLKVKMNHKMIKPDTKRIYWLRRRMRPRFSYVVFFFFFFLFFILFYFIFLCKNIWRTFYDPSVIVLDYVDISL